ncbi:amino acid ABC transporter permease [Amycolatopsis jejuensis]|uniref:amino acid ABC transporter permease n=1 Tax=Amycolatopsis jejuensis TaxID=330084 RepID=UPI00069123F8|nr:amino acid ABC transporter permease [Amycolatopsis jejuensis]
MHTTRAELPDAPPIGQEPVRAVPLRHPGRWIAAAVVLVIAAALIYSAVTNPRFKWPLVGRFLFAPEILDGILVTLKLTVIAMAMGIVLGVVLAVMRRSENLVVAGAARAYIWFFRGTPVLVQLLFWSFLAAVYPVLSIGVPFGGPVLLHGDANSLVTPMTAAILGLGLNEAAYMAEIVRAGIKSVDEGQTEAALAIGMRPLQIMRRIVLPQAMRVIIPPTGNETISMLKTTSLVSVIAYADLLYAAQLIYASNFEQVPLLIVVCFWYLLGTTLLSFAQSRLERRFSRGQSRTSRQRRRAPRYGGRK